MAASDFFSRWAVKTHASLPLQPASLPLQPEALTAPDACTAAVPSSALPSSALPPPTLEQAQALQPADDFRPFVQAGVEPRVRNAAMKQLFADPHFNVMDGLDVYIDDYHRPDPLPAADLARMASAHFLRLLQSEPEAHANAAGPSDPAAPVDPAAPAPPPVPTLTDKTHRDDPDLQLQPHPEPRSASPGPGAD